MSANVIQMPKRIERDLISVQLEFRTPDIAKALGRTGVLQGPPDRPGWRWYRCRCPLCGGGLRIANHGNRYDNIDVDCAQGCAPTKVVEELIRLGHMRCQSGWRRA
jgi:hypothetical protein